MRTRTIALALSAVLCGASWVLADCAQFISGGAGNAAAGYLLGEQLVTEETSFGLDGTAYAGRTVRVQYSVGFYQMENGGRIRVDCRTYSQI